jgi:type IV secretion system protein VirB10
MTTDTHSIQPDDPANLNAAPAAPEVVEDIVSVNKKGTSDNKLGKAIFFLLVGALLVGVLAWISQNWLNARKAQMKANSAPKAAEDTTQVFNPEKTGAAVPKPKLGSDSGIPPPSQAPTANANQPGATREDGVRPLRGSDGKVMVNGQGRALGVDKNGNVVEVPAIAALANDPAAGRKPLPGEAATGQIQGQGAGQPAQQKPPSRFGGSLFVGDAAKPSGVNAAGAVEGGGTVVSNAIAQTQAQQIAEILRSAGLGGGQGARTGATPPTQVPAATPFFGQPPGATPNSPPEQARPGTVGGALYSSPTPAALAKRMSDLNLMLPKGRQADCILTGRIIDEVPGFTSCVLAQNLYSNGGVLLIERGSELTGDYGVTNQLGLERLFVTWTRVLTPEGIEVDLSSPGADRLGTSGVPGHLDNRWGARIGGAFLLSFVKDITVAIINNQTKAAAGTSVNIQTTPGQNTLNASSALAEEVIKQTIKVRPRLTINEGDRISIYVARDLDFSPVYALKTAGIAGATRLLTK